MAWSYQLKCCQSHLICWIFKEKPENLSPKHQKSDIPVHNTGMTSTGVCLSCMGPLPTSIGSLTSKKHSAKHQGLPQTITHPGIQKVWPIWYNNLAGNRWNIEGLEIVSLHVCSTRYIYHHIVEVPVPNLLQFTNSRTCGGPWQITLFCHIRTDV